MERVSRAATWGFLVFQWHGLICYAISWRLQLLEVTQSRREPSIWFFSVWSNEENCMDENSVILIFFFKISKSDFYFLISLPATFNSKKKKNLDCVSNSFPTMMQGRLDLEIVFLDHLLITETIQFTLSFYTITMHFCLAALEATSNVM